MWKWILALILFFAVVVELVFFAPQSGDREVHVTGEEKAAIPMGDSEHEQVLSGSHLVESQGETKLWELVSKVAKKKKASEEWTLDGVDVKFYGKSNVSYKAIGKTGYVGKNQNSLKIDGDVKITSSNQYVLTTEVIFYQTKTRSIDGPESVEMVGPPEADGKGGPLYMKGDRFDADLTTNIINLYDNVRGRKEMSDNRKMKISSRKAVFSGKSNFALFKDDVVIHVDSMTITGPRAKFLYKNNALHSLFINGGVKIKDIGKWGKAGEAEVYFKEDKYVFRGSPMVVQGKDELIGDEITVFDGGDRIRVKKAKAKYQTKSQEGK